MKLTFKNLAQPEPLFEIGITNSQYQNSHFIEEKICILNDKIQEINAINLISHGVVISNIKVHFSSPQTMQFEITGESVVLSFIGCNSIKATINPLENEKHLRENTHNILYAHNLNGKFEIPAFEEINCFSIILSLDYYYKLINEDWGIHQKFSKTISQKTSSYLTPQYVPFSPAIQWILHEIKNCTFQGTIQKMYLETKIKELVILQLDSILIKPATEVSLIDKEDYIKLLEAKSILESDFVNAPTLPELSRAISLNEFKLKKGFKACFETTIKSYTTKLRMEYAKKLFKNKSSNVSEVAEKCGYKDVSHFSAAFKLFYGFTPISFRKNHLGIKLSLLFCEILEIFSLEFFIT